MIINNKRLKSFIQGLSLNFVILLVMGILLGLYLGTYISEFFFFIPSIIILIFYFMILLSMAVRQIEITQNEIIIQKILSAKVIKKDDIKMMKYTKHNGHVMIETMKKDYTIYFFLPSDKAALKQWKDAT